MPKIPKNQLRTSNKTLISNILEKFEITTLNPMQRETHKAIRSENDIVLLSPTGTGKTLAFILPLLERLDPNLNEIQILILVPSRELAQQIEQVTRKMGSGYKVNAVYGGRSGQQDKLDLKQRPAVLIGSPGRIADRLRRDDFTLQHINTLIIDEYDKSLEIGFDNEMEEIIQALPKVQQRILTSATSDVGIPEFLGLDNPIFINYIKENHSKLVVKTISSTDKDKLETLKKTLTFIGPHPGIVFCNFKDSLERISEFLNQNDFTHECYHGSMEQIDRERALVKFRNGTTQLLLATDLAALGLDIPDLKFIVHYHLPMREKEFTHRNGRTARMNNDGMAYVLHWEGEELPEFIQEVDPEILKAEELPQPKYPKGVKRRTLYITGGRRDKISKGDIAGLFIKKGGIQPEQLGVIEVKQNCAYVGIDAKVVNRVIEKLNNTKLKTKKVRISLI
ncbi:superfamily II DNA/RNA helicase [Balneicella halophila]|uniref:Superfamily II DNA/RNA helicase n=1 Tax=Balneicella halophila TaxID=1537566 RepID=A0A7L4URF6_BALHA|nr:DEAD/DEAH box helicase [Balneicella halophila]PVX51817.1 superfamily II DNA/RNA helicase [Balneicella halophila]